MTEAEQKLAVIIAICEQAEEDSAWVSAVRKIKEVASQ